MHLKWCQLEELEISWYQPQKTCLCVFGYIWCSLKNRWLSISKENWVVSSGTNWFRSIYFSSSTLFKFTANFTEVYLLIFRKKSEVIYWSICILYKISFNTSVLYLAICIIYRICSGYQFLRKHGFYQNLAYMCQGLFSTDVQLLVPLLFRFKRVHSIL